MGRLVFVLAIFLFLSAVNSANNLFYLVFSLFLAFVAAPAHMARRTFDGLRAERRFPARITAGEEVVSEVVVHNDSGAEKYLFAVADDFPGAAVEGRGFFSIAPGESLRTSIRYRFGKRGANMMLPLRAASMLPFLVRPQSAPVDAGTAVIVYPVVAKARIGADMESDRARRLRKNFNTSTSEFDKFKEYGMGDSIHKVNWRHYTATRTLVVPKFEEEDYGGFAVVLMLPSGCEPYAPAYELALGAAAGIATALFEKRHGFRLVTASSSIRAMDSRASGLDRMMAHISLLEGSHAMGERAVRKLFYETAGALNVYVVTPTPSPAAGKLAKMLGRRLRRVIYARAGSAEASPAWASGRAVTIDAPSDLEKETI